MSSCAGCAYLVANGWTKERAELFHNDDPLNWFKRDSLTEIEDAAIQAWHEENWYEEINQGLSLHGDSASERGDSASGAVR